MKFGTDGDGNYGYYGADGSLIPFSGSEKIYYGTYSSFVSQYGNYVMDIDVTKYNKAFIYSYANNKANNLSVRVKLDDDYYNNASGGANFSVIQTIDISNVSRFMVEGYTGNNYAPPQGTLFAIVAFSKGDIEASKYS